MARRVSPTERLRAQIDELFGWIPSWRRSSRRLSVRLMMQTAVEARSTSSWAGAATSAGTTTMGPDELQRPKLRDTDEAFCSRLFGTGVTRTNALASLVISGWVRALSDRDIEAALAEVLGPEAALSPSTGEPHPRRHGAGAIQTQAGLEDSGESRCGAAGDR
ncbi:MAG: hypothetical protein M3Q48_12795 [Actinomycetota bacterium]|nr:hypothetical protein [Actinomycetota bacterium]